MRQLGIAAALVILVLAGSTKTTDAFAGSCAISSTGVVFGPYNVLVSQPTDSTGSISVDCTASQNVSVTLSQGLSGSYAARTMRKGADALAYNLFLDAAYNTIWGNGAGSTGQADVRVNKNKTLVLTVYGRIPAQQNAAVGSYSDSITVTVVF